MSDILAFQPTGDPVRQPTLWGDVQLNVRQVIDWYWQHGLKRAKHEKGIRERKRIHALFCDFRPQPLADDPCAGLALGDRPTDRCRPHHLLEFLNFRACIYCGEPAREARWQRKCPKCAKSVPNLLADWTVKRWATTVQTPFNSAAGAGLIGRNPFRGPKFPQGNNGRDATWEEIRAVLRAATPEFRRLVIFCTMCGARPGEGRTLRASSVRMDLKAVVLREHKTAHTQAVRKPRSIQFTPPLVKLLIWLLRRRDPAQELLFLNSQGRPWTTRALCQNLAKIRTKLGLPEDLKLYGTRHYYGTLAIINGVDLASLKELMGHNHVATTQRYVHLAAKSGHLTEAAEKAIRKK